jgi:hypothetical protein
VKLIKNTILRPFPYLNKRYKIYERHQESPPWEEIVETIIKEFEVAED